MLTPDQFKVNEVWIAVKINKTNLFVKDGPYDIYVLMDAASSYVFGHVFSKGVDKAPLERAVEILFRKAWDAKSQWSKKLIVPEEFPEENVFRIEAEKNGISFETVPISELAPIVEPLKQLFASDFG